MTREQPARIPSLDGIRAISITLVIVGHLLAPSIPHSQALASPVFLVRGLGPLGVRIFFVISGFLITSLLLGEVANTGRLNLPRFYFRRTLRIFPPYYCFVLTMLLAHALGWVVLARGDLLHALSYTINYFPDRAWATGHTWSLSVEEQFYLLWPAIVLLAGRRLGMWIAGAVVILCPVVRIVYSALFPGLVWQSYEFLYRFETVADAIAAGCLLAGGLDWLRRQPLAQRLFSSRLFIVMPLLVIAANLVNPRMRTSLLIGFTVQNLAIAACIAWCIAHPSGLVGRGLNSRPLVFIGIMSYSIYLWQQPFVDPSSSSIVTRFPLNLLLIAIAALASFYLVERPSLASRRWLEARWAARSARRVERAADPALTGDAN